MKITYITLLLSLTLVIQGCSKADPGNTSSAATASGGNSAGNSAASKPANTPAANSESAAKPKNDSCKDLKLAGKNFIAKQSFPIDFEPFAGGCFATFGSKDEMLDEKDVPRGSTFHIFKDGKSVLDLPDGFDGQAACWVEAVSFKDLNGDGKTDIIMAGSCLAAKDSYPSNAVYVNSGKTFTTDADANSKLNELKSVKAIEDYVTSHLKSFF
ncbi:MAG: FG-GAP repeat protein [Pyrinomonadaceae bacterium]|nr:FG-GAP repeat protein [Pyrinomonadaceae bacterium]